MKYQWREGGPKPPVDANIFGGTVEKIVSGSDINAVKPEAVVDAARNKSSPIHSMFNWDDAEAAELHRRHQARNYLGALQIVRVEVKGGSAVSSRAFYSVRAESGREYAPHSRILTDADLRKQVIASARDELESYINKYASVLTLGSYVPRLRNVLDDMRSELDDLAAKAVTPRGRQRPRETAMSIAAE